MDGRRVDAIEVSNSNGTTRLDADWYVLALPVEVVIGLLEPEVEAAAPRLMQLQYLRTSWMNGIQFYLDRDVVVSHGHGLYLDSTWALTSISQAQFWERDLSAYGDGTVRGILSIVISDWERQGMLIPKPAKECTPDEIRREVWFQLERHLHDDEFAELDGARLVHWFLDDSIVYPNPNETVNLEPLLINTAGSWDDRPRVDVGLENMFLASDYVRTNTDLATMEAANEAARRAVNTIIDRSGVAEEWCDIWPLDEWPVFEPFKRADDWLYERGQPHLFELFGR